MQKHFLIGGCAALDSLKELDILVSPGHRGHPTSFRTLRLIRGAHSAAAILMEDRVGANCRLVASRVSAPED
jgi:hypothetical protein